MNAKLQWKQSTCIAYFYLTHFWQHLGGYWIYNHSRIAASRAFVRVVWFNRSMCCGVTYDSTCQWCHTGFSMFWDLPLVHLIENVLKFSETMYFDKSWFANSVAVLFWVWLSRFFRNEFMTLQRSPFFLLSDWSLTIFLRLVIGSPLVTPDTDSHQIVDSYSHPIGPFKELFLASKFI